MKTRQGSDVAGGSSDSDIEDTRTKGKQDCDMASMFEKLSAELSLMRQGFNERFDSMEKTLTAQITESLREYMAIKYKKLCQKKSHLSTLSGMRKLIYCRRKSSLLRQKMNRIYH